MTYRQSATLGVIGGAWFAAGITLIITARAVTEITRAGRWYQLKRL